jgi:hypothetical protein
VYDGYRAERHEQYAGVRYGGFRGDRAGGCFSASIETAVTEQFHSLNLW